MTMRQPVWPVLKTYDDEHLERIALPLGGIGTGTVSLGGRGDLRDWEICNTPAKGFSPHQTFFALWTKPAGGEAVTRCLEGELQPPYEGASGSKEKNHGLPRFRQARFRAAYPFGQVDLSDPEVPLSVTIQAFNPLVPGDSDASGMPFACLRFVLKNTGKRAVKAAVCGNLANFIGRDGKVGSASKNVNQFRVGRGVRGIFMRSEGIDPHDERFGTIGLVTTARRTSHRTAWARISWGDSLLDYWDDFSTDGAVEERAVEGEDAPQASLAVPVTVPPGQERVVTFIIAWHFPNRLAWEWKKKPSDPEPTPGKRHPAWVGNHYATRFKNAWDASEKAIAQLKRLESRTIDFVDAFISSDLPLPVREAALFNLSTLRSQTCFRTADGRFYGWEGTYDQEGSCFGSCTHVWNYEQSTAFLFGDLARCQRDIEFKHATGDNGQMSFRVHLPIARARDLGKSAADGQMGCLMKLYRDWQLCGDDSFLRGLWPKARKALEFCWIAGGWDADRDGVMEGCQHNTMDVEYYGPNPQMQFWYLGALRACSEMARHLGETTFAEKCQELFNRGSDWTDEHLFNGRYYEQQVRPTDVNSIAPELRANMGCKDSMNPEQQLGAGCLVDQLVGQYQAHICGLGYLADREKIGKTLRSIHRYNFKRGLHGHFNHLRSFALADESALLMASYPLGRRPKRPFPYFNEVMTGFEYTAATGMIYEGMVPQGLQCIAAIRARYDGRRRSPFDEAECGHHYARAMAAWSAPIALTGFQYSGVSQTIAFTAKPGKGIAFWSNGYAWGTCRQRRHARGIAAEITVIEGQLRLANIALVGCGRRNFPTKKVVPGKPLRMIVPDARVPTQR